MPFDYGNYLLATSPPGFDSQYLLTESFKLLDVGPGLKKIGKNCFKDNGLNDGVSKKLADARAAWQQQDEPELQFDSVVEYSSEASNKAAGKSGQRKHVSFADELGKALFTVKIMMESSDTPPKLNRDSPVAAVAQDVDTKLDLSQLQLNFNQPAADYVLFRRKLEANCVSLENVITRERRFYGTIKVKNLAFDKRVVLHCTFDDWQHCSNIEATYAHPSDPSHQFDVFSFSVTVPLDAHRALFAVCFELTSSGTQFWDNNGGSNYEVIVCSAPRDDDVTDAVSPVFSLDPLTRPTQWTEFAVWTSAGSDVPYY